MTDYHFGAFVRIIENAGIAMTRIISGALQVFARNTPVEFAPDDPDKLPGYLRWWYAGSQIIHNDPFSGTITYAGMTFSLPYPEVLVAHVANNILYFAVDSGSSTITLYVIDLTNATPSDTVQDPTDKIQPVVKIDPAGVLTNYSYYVSGPFVGDLGEFTDAITIPGDYTRVLVPALNSDCTGFTCGYGLALNQDWLAKVLAIVIANDPPTPEQLAAMQANPTYPDNLTIGVYMDSFTPSDWDGVRTPYGPSNVAFNSTNSPGDLGTSPTEQSWSARQNSHAYTAGQTIHINVVGYEGPYWIADNSGTSANLGAGSVSTFFDAEDPERPDVPVPKASVSDGSVTWSLGGRIEGSPTGAFTYTDPISSENVALDGYAYGTTLETLMADYVDQAHVANTGPDSATYPFMDIDYTVVDGPTAFSNTSWETIPVGYGATPFGADDIIVNPLTTRAVKYKKTVTKYDTSDIPQTPVDSWFYLTSSRSLFLYRYELRSGVPDYSNLSPNGSNGVTGRQLIGWCLNKTSLAVEEMTYQELSGSTTTASTTGTRPTDARYTSWPGAQIHVSQKADYYAEIVAAEPGSVSGGDYSYTDSGDERIIRGFYIGDQLQYEFYDGYQAFDKHGSLSGSSYAEAETSGAPFVYTKTNTGGTLTIVEEYSGKKQDLITLAGPPYRQLCNYQAQAYGLIGWEESSWFAEGGSASRSIDQTIACAVAGTITYTQTNTLVDSTTADYDDANGILKEPYIAPLNTSGACLFSLYWQYLDSWSGGGTANPYVNQKLFTSAGQALTQVNFNGTVVALDDLNTAYPGSGADPMYLEIVSE